MHQLSIHSIQPSGRQLFHLVCDTPDEVRDSFTKPGQFLEVALDDPAEKKGFFAIASRPGAERMEFLVKAAGQPAEAICSRKPGETLYSSLAKGNGFPESGSERPTHLFSMGSGLAPCRSVILAHLAGTHPAPGGLTLWQASFTREHLPFADEYEDWRKAGVKVELCLDEGEGRTGSVVERLEELGPDLREARAFWIGSKEFGRTVQETATGLGLLPDRLHSNY